MLIIFGSGLPKIGSLIAPVHSVIPNKQFEEHAINKVPMKRFGKHEELANLAAFLISDMAEYINGECVVIDGGQWLRGAGEFNDLALLTDPMWEQLEAARPKK